MTAGPYSIGSDHWPGVAKLLEEMGELTQELGKLIASGGDPAHWDGKGDLVARVTNECGDVRAALIFFCVQNGIDQTAVHRRADMKLERFRDWHATN